MKDAGEIAEYFAGKQEWAVNEGLAHLDMVIDRGREFLDQLSSNDLLSTRCCVDRCLARGEKCLACQAYSLMDRVVDLLEASRKERHEAARAAEDMRRGPRARPHIR